MKWFAMELNAVEWAGIRPILKELGCQYESSACGMMVHVEVYCTPDVAGAINDKIDEL